jgi:hypothetical protein
MKPIVAIIVEIIIHLLGCLAILLKCNVHAIPSVNIEKKVNNNSSVLHFPFLLSGRKLASVETEKEAKVIVVIKYRKKYLKKSKRDEFKYAMIERDKIPEFNNGRKIPIILHESRHCFNLHHP